jgi:3-oxoacyl-[acyl-carrier-protein] synthase II
MNAPRRVAITGLGAITPLGNTPETFFTTLMAGKSGIGRLQADFTEQLDCKIAAQCDFNGLDYFKKHRASTLDRASQFALVATQQAVDDAGLQFASLDRTRTGVSIGTIEADLKEFDELYVRLFKQGAKRLKPFTILMNMNSSPASHIAMEYKLLGLNLTYSIACSSSAIAIGEAFEKIRYGMADVMLAGGTESPLAFGFIKAWEALRILAKEDENDPAMSCKPFAADRSGLVLGEGAAIVVLEEWDHAKARGAKIYGELTGYGCTNDPAHITQPSFERQAAAMQAALASANLTPNAISYINAHGTATLLNDAAETAAIKQVFGDAAQRIPVSSTKSMHGHLMGATSAVEFIACVKALEHNAIPPTCNLFNPDPACDLDYVPNAGRTGIALQHIMTNSFAFGGTSGVLIVSKENAD